MYTVYWSFTFANLPILVKSSFSIMPEREVFTVILPVYQSAFFNGLKKVQTQENFKILDLYLRATTWFFVIMSEREDITL